MMARRDVRRQMTWNIVAMSSARADGILPSQEIRALVRSGEIAAAVEIAEEQIQPASLDLRLGGEAFRVRASFLPGAQTSVLERIEAFAMHRFGLADGAVLERAAFTSCRSWRA